MSSSFQSGYQEQNIPQVLQPPSSIPPNQQQYGQGHGPGYGPEQGQADGRPRIYNPSFSQYSQSNTTTNEMWNNIREAGSRNYGKRNRIMIGLVVAIFFLMATHQSNADRKSKGPEETLVKVVKEEEHATKDTKKKETTKGLAGDKPVPIPDRPVDKRPKMPNDKAKTKDADEAPAPPAPPSPPTLTYLLAYPQSGAGYTIEIFEAAANVNTATNYEANIRKSSTMSLVLPEAIASPYWHTTNQNYTYPQNRILTLTHCDGYRTSDTDVIPDYIFEQGCRTVRDKKNVNPKVLPRQYWDPTKRTIHLIRDPFSNVVSQSHLYRYTHAAETSIGRYFPFHSELEEDKAEFRKYCGQIDKMDLTGFKIDQEMAAILEKVPCGLDFLKYVHWHMLANKMNQRSGSVKFGERGIDNIGAPFSYPEESSDSLVIYSEAFQSEAKTNEVLAMVTVFLGLENVDFTKRPDFKSARMYKHYYTEEERKAVEELFRVMLAHDVETWNLLKHYFD